MPHTLTFASSLIAGLLILGSAAFASAGLRIEVDLSMRMLTAYDGPEAVKTYSVSVGTN